MTTIEEVRQINEGHKKLNQHLREEMKVLMDVAFEMYDLLSQIDFANMDGELKMVFTENVKYDDVPWERWEAALEQKLSLKAHIIDAPSTENENKVKGNQLPLC